MKLKSLIYSKRFSQVFGVVLLVCLIAYGVVAQVKPTKVSPIDTHNTGLSNGSGWQQGGLLKAKGTLSQTKVVQGSDGQIYLQIDLEALKDPKVRDMIRKPTDFVVVLDRSGSMSGEGKIEYAKQAIVSLLKQLNEYDRFALVTFDSVVETAVDFKQVNSDNREELIQLVSNISPRGSTDLGGGLQRGIKILKKFIKDKKHAKRLILVSDGMTNLGITDPTALGKMASSAIGGEFVISTIGVGLDFNETLLASIADFGTGSYYFLENPSKMDQVLAKEFYGASEVLAKNLKINFDLASGVKILDASGYPINQHGKYKVVQPGHLYKEQKKSVFVTLKVPTGNLYSEQLGRVRLSYEIDNKAYDLTLVDSDTTIACLPKEKEKDVIASIDKPTYSKAWGRNNVGVFMKEGSDYIRKGEYKKAKEALKRFKDKLVKAYGVAPSQEISDQIKNLEDMDTKIEESEAGGVDEQKRLSKDLHYKGSQQQRTNK